MKKKNRKPFLSKKDKLNVVVQVLMTPKEEQALRALVKAMGETYMSPFVKRLIKKACEDNQKAQVS